MSKKIGVVDVGGGLRGIYAAGVLDYCMEEGITFDLGIGVSAGSANLASFIAKQPKRNYQFYTEYAMRKQYMSAGNFFRTGSYIGLDYIYGTLSNSDGESPLDYKTMQKNPMEFIVVATDAWTGKARYFDKWDLCQDHYDIFKASSAIPVVCKPYTIDIDNRPYYDGALGDPVPIEKAFEMGCDKVVLILTLPKDKDREPGKDVFLASRMKSKYLLASQEMLRRAEHYNQSVALAKEYEKQGKLLIISPDDTCGVSTLSREVKSLCRLYEKGYGDAAVIKAFIES